eukprot:5285898-Amphidinium_carterae.1
MLYFGESLVMPGGLGLLLLLSSHMGAFLSTVGECSSQRPFATLFCSFKSSCALSGICPSKYDTSFLRTPVGTSSQRLDLIIFDTWVLDYRHIGVFDKDTQRHRGRSSPAAADLTKLPSSPAATERKSSSSKALMDLSPAGPQKPDALDSHCSSERNRHSTMIVVLDVVEVIAMIPWQIKLKS